MGGRKNFPSFQKRGEKTWFKDRQCPASPGKEILGCFFPFYLAGALPPGVCFVPLLFIATKNRASRIWGQFWCLSLVASSKSHLAQRRWKFPNSWEQRGFTEAWLEQVLSVAEILDFP